MGHSDAVALFSGSQDPWGTYGPKEESQDQTTWGLGVCCALGQCGCLGLQSGYEVTVLPPKGA